VLSCAIELSKYKAVAFILLIHTGRRREKTQAPERRAATVLSD
jgi:hypothetical protein